jgi:hypothetical protein
MSFIGQIALDKDIFGEVAGKMAYLFISEKRTLRGPYTFDPGSGENAVIVQPGNNAMHLLQPLNEGPRIFSLQQSDHWLLYWKRRKIYVEYDITVTRKEDPALVDWEQDEPDPIVPYELNDCKLGGSPVWIQDKAWPYADSKGLLVQIVTAKFPLYLGLGDSATLYAFLSKEGDAGKLLWQCY